MPEAVRDRFEIQPLGRVTSAYEAEDSAHSVLDPRLFSQALTTVVAPMPFGRMFRVSTTSFTFA
jgi:hypothetical protein